MQLKQMDEEENLEKQGGQGLDHAVLQPSGRTLTCSLKERESH